MKLLIAVATALPLLVACGADRGRSGAAAQSAVAEEVSKEMYALGTEVTPGGAVPKDAAGETFRRGSEVFLSVNVNSASTDQKIEVKWLDPAGEVLRRDERHVTRDKNYVPFSSGETATWPRGEHRAVVLIDGRSVSEKPFTLM